MVRQHQEQNGQRYVIVVRRPRLRRLDRFRVRLLAGEERGDALALIFGMMTKKAFPVIIVCHSQRTGVDQRAAAGKDQRGTPEPVRTT